MGATKDLKFVRQILTFLNEKPTGPTPLVIDNEGMWFNVRNAGVSARTRHFESWQQFVRHAYQSLVLTVHRVDTHSCVADIFTKAMPKLTSSYDEFKKVLHNIVG